MGLSVIGQTHFFMALVESINRKLLGERLFNTIF